MQAMQERLLRLEAERAELIDERAHAEQQRSYAEEERERARERKEKDEEEQRLRNKRMDSLERRGRSPLQRQQSSAAIQVA